MAFCNSCGATQNPGTKFCNKCGAPFAAGTPASAPAPVVASAPASAVATTPASTGGSSALKIILIVIAVIVVIGILGMATVGFIGYRIAKRTHVRQEGDHVKVETPFGSVESSQDPDQAAKDLGIELYPGAEVQKNGASSATFGGIHTVTANFETSDSVDKVCTFYKAQFPNAMVTTSDQNHCNLVSNERKNMITITVASGGDTTHIQMANISKKAASESSSN